MRHYPKTSEKINTVPLFVKRGGFQDIDFRGSGTLVTFGGRYFLCTAAHVLGENEKHDLILGGCSPAIPLTRPFMRNRLEEGIGIHLDPIEGASLNWVGERGRDRKLEAASHPVTNGLEIEEIAEASGAPPRSLDDTIDSFDGR